jgi:hypothetical protein
MGGAYLSTHENPPQAFAPGSLIEPNAHSSITIASYHAQFMAWRQATKSLKFAGIYIRVLFARVYLGYHAARG